MSLTMFDSEIVKNLDRLMDSNKSISIQPKDPQLVVSMKMSVADQISRRKLYSEISSEYLKGYNIAKQEEKKGKHTTHQLITKNALRKLKLINSDTIIDALIEGSSGPDENIRNMKLMMEGHFYGKRNDSSLGNYIPKYFNWLEINAMGLIDDIDENARVNFLKYNTEYSSSEDNLDSLSWAMHYLQDLTAPHHVRNFPAYFTKRKSGEEFDTHVAFEKHANSLFTDNELRFDQSVDSIYDKILRESFDLDSENGINKFVDYVYENALQVATDEIRTMDENSWTAVIDKALPFAIATSMLYVKYKIKK